MVLVPVPAVDGVKMPVSEFTPGPEYVPPRGIPPLRRIGLAVIVVIVSKQVEKDTAGASDPDRLIVFELAGFPVTQESEEFKMHRTLSPLAGL
jgi:hypothetical protein